MNQNLVMINQERIHNLVPSSQCSIPCDLHYQVGNNNDMANWVNLAQSAGAILGSSEQKRDSYFYNSRHINVNVRKIKQSKSYRG